MRGPDALALLLSVLLSLWCAMPVDAADAADATVAPAPAKPIQRTAPPGFEDLAATEVEMFPILLGGTQVGQAEARVDLAALTFTDPAAVAALVPDLADPGAVVAALSGALPLRAELACDESGTKGCGYLAPKVAGIIFDRTARQVRLFINPEQRRFTGRLDRLHPAAIAPGLIGGANLFFSGDADGGTPTYTLNLNATAGMGHRHLLSRGSLTRDRGNLDTLAYRAVRDGDELRIGLFEGATSQFRGNERLVGLRWGSTLDDLADRGAYDAPLVVALVAPARIDVFAGDRLIGSARYPAGAVRIDTSGFPGGAYPVRLRIDEGGAVREEERFFSRELGYPPFGAPQSFIAIGMRRSPAGFTAQREGMGAELQLGRRQTLGAGFGAGGSLFLREDSVALEAGATRAFKAAQVSAGLFYSSKGELGASLGQRTEVGPWSLSLDLRYAQPTGDDGSHHMLGTDTYTQANLSVNRRFGKAMFSMFGYWRDSSQGGGSWSAMPSVDLPVTLFGSSGTLRFSASLGPGDTQARIEFNLTRSPWRGGSLTTRAGYAHDNNPGALGEVALQQSVQRGETQGNLGLKMRADPSRQELGLNSRLSAPVAALGLDFNRDLQSGRTTYFGSLDAGMALTRGGMAFGQSSRSDAAVVFSNRSRSREASGLAIVDGANVAKVAPGSRRMYGASSFKKVSASLIPVGGIAVATAQRPVLAGLFPGTVALIDADFVQVTAAYGRLVDRDGKPVADAWIDSGLAQAQTDADGWFQIDAAAGAEVQARLADRKRCRFEVKGAAGGTRRDLLALGEVVCRE